MLSFINPFYVPSWGKKKKRKVNLIAYAEIKQLPLHHWDLQSFRHTLSDFR